MRDGPGWEWLDVDVGSSSGVVLLVPAGEGREEEECDKSENKSHDTRESELVMLDRSLSGLYLHQVGEHYAVLEGVGNPDQIEWIRIERDLLGEESGVV